MMWMVVDAGLIPVAALSFSLAVLFILQGGALLSWWRSLLFESLALGSLVALGVVWTHIAGTTGTPNFFFFMCILAVLVVRILKA